MVAYAVAVAFYTLLAIWRMRRATKNRKRGKNSLGEWQSLTVTLGFGPRIRT